MTLKRVYVRFLGMKVRRNSLVISTLFTRLLTPPRLVMWDPRSVCSVLGSGTG